mgnify:FL=1|tara:strand:- start:394 stop:936 length:543 start_codon:yes stop_codon:yes gene_type:complete
MSLSKIQKELKAPKSQHNKFGNYRYRNCEDITEAVKPLLAAEGYHLNLSDEVVQIGERFYVQATAKVMSGAEVIEQSVSYAREALAKKGMDESQITGSSSSYARKYALNGLFAIDDTKDSDSQDNTEKPLTKPQQGFAAKMKAAKTLEEIKTIWAKLSETNRQVLRDVANEAREKLNGQG